MSHNTRLCFWLAVLLSMSGSVVAESFCNCSAPGCSCSATCNPPTPHAWCSCDPPPCQCGCYAKPPVEPPKSEPSWNWSEVAEALLNEITLTSDRENLTAKLDQAGIPTHLLTLPKRFATPTAPWHGTTLELLRFVAAHTKRGKVVIGGIPILPQPLDVDPAKTPVSLQVREASAPVIFVMGLSFYDQNWTFLLEVDPDKAFELAAAKITLKELEVLLQAKVRG